MLLYPSLARAKVRRSWAGLRPITPDALPIVGADPSLRGLWYATGYGRNGILLAGLTGMLLRQLMAGETPAMDLQPFAPDRF
jgi:sarcosine oxidase subunit beta